jgi:chromosome segregation ATPase
MVGGQNCCRQCEVYQERLTSLRSDIEVLKVPPFSASSGREDQLQEDLAERNRVLEQRLTMERNSRAEQDESLKSALSELQLQKELNLELQNKISQSVCGPILEKSYHAEQHDDVERYSQLQGEIEWLKKKNGILELEMEQRALKYCEKLEKAAKREQILLEKIKAYESDLESTNKYFSDAKSTMTVLDDRIATLTRIVNEHESENDQLRTELAEAFRAKSQLERMLEQYKDDLARQETQPRIDHILLSEDEYVQNFSSKPMSIPSKRN